MKNEKIYNFLNLTKGQLVIVVVLVGALGFFLSLWVLRIEKTPDPTVFVSYWGFPFEALKVKTVIGAGVYPDLGTLVSGTRTYEYLWGGILMNLIIYIIFSVVLVKLAIWIRDEIEYHRYYTSG